MKTSPSTSPWKASLDDGMMRPGDSNTPYFQAVLLDMKEHAVDVSLLDDGSVVLFCKANENTVRLTRSQASALRRVLKHF